MGIPQLQLSHRQNLLKGSRGRKIEPPKKRFMMTKWNGLNL